jgi:hypothetical protein
VPSERVDERGDLAALHAKFLLPTLRWGDIVGVDNLAAYKVAGIAEVIQSIGAQVHCAPPCSPNLIAIAPMLAEQTALPGRARRRIIDDLCTRIGTLLAEVSPRRDAPTTLPMPAMEFVRKTP